MSILSDLALLYFARNSSNVSSRHFRNIELEYDSLPACVPSFLFLFSFICSLLNHLVQKPLGEMDKGLPPLEKEVSA